MQLSIGVTKDQKDHAARIVKKLTLREKIGQTAQEACSSRMSLNHEKAEEYFSHYPYGSLFCGGEIIQGAGGTSETIRRSLSICEKVSKVPLLVAGDLEHGAGCAVQDLTVFPHALALGAARDEKLAYELGRYTALEGRAAGFNWTFSPVVDLAMNWLNPIVTTRSLGDDPQAVACLAQAIIRGLQDHGMAACAKHFPGDGVDFKDQHLVTSVNSLSEKDWWQYHGAVFQAVIDAGVYTIMPGHIALPWLDPKPAGQRRYRPATVCREILTGLLREQMNFEGVLVSDALIMGGYTGWGPREKRMIESFNAGIDVMLWPGEDYFDIMDRALNEGLVSSERLEESVKRVLELKIKLGLIAVDLSDEDVQTTSLADIQSAAQKVSNQIAEESITLVCDHNRLLPLDPTKIKRILVHQAVPEGLSQSGMSHLELFTDSLKARGIELTVLTNGNCLDIQKMETQGDRWDAYLVIFSQFSHQQKNTIRPAGPMAEVMWTMQNVETLNPITISFGTPFLLKDMPYLDTLINVYSTASGTVRALDRALFGEIPFTSFSPVSIEMEKFDQVPGLSVRANDSCS